MSINLSFLPGYQCDQAGQGLPAGPRRHRRLCRTTTSAATRPPKPRSPSSKAMFRNFWSFNVEPSIGAESLSNRPDPGRPDGLSPWGWNANFIPRHGQPQALRPGRIRPRSTSVRRTASSWMAQISLNWKPRSNVSLSIGPPVLRSSKAETQWVGRFTDPLMTSTFGRAMSSPASTRAIVSAEIRLNWTFTPRLSLQAYLQPFIARRRLSTGSRSWPGPGPTTYNVYRRGRVDGRLRRTAPTPSTPTATGRLRPSPSAIPTST